MDWMVIAGSIIVVGALLGMVAAVFWGKMGE